MKRYLLLLSKAQKRFNRFAIRLWRKRTSYLPLVYVVHEGDYISSQLAIYLNELKSDGAVNVKTVSAMKMDCALKAQVVRLLAYKWVCLCKKNILLYYVLHWSFDEKSKYAPATLHKYMALNMLECHYSINTVSRLNNSKYLEILWCPQETQ